MALFLLKVLYRGPRFNCWLNLVQMALNNSACREKDSRDFEISVGIEYDLIFRSSITQNLTIL